MQQSTLKGIQSGGCEGGWGRGSVDRGVVGSARFGLARGWELVIQYVTF
jgi:hypothetical protein